MSCPADSKDQEPERWLRQRSVWRCVEELASQGPASHPLAVELHLGTACNLACPECISRTTLNTLCFDDTRAVSIAQELVAIGARSVVLSGGGEPLLHPAFDSVVRTLAQGGLSVSLVTNGTLLEDHLDTLVAHVRRVWVSVDAATPLTHHRFRPARSGRDTLDSVLRALTTIAPKLGPRLTFSFLLLTSQDPTTGEILSNVEEIAQAASLARSLDCGAFELNLALDSTLRPNPRHIHIAPRLTEQLRRTQALDSNDFRVFLSPLVAFLASEQSLPASPRRSYARCPAAQLRTLLSPRGLFLCPSHQNQPSARFGDPLTQPLSELWASDAHRAALERIDPRRDCPDACWALDLNERLLKGVAWAQQHKRPPTLLEDEDLIL